MDGMKTIVTLTRLGAARCATRASSGRPCKATKAAGLPSTIRKGLLRIEESLTPPEMEADIEACYRELRGRGLLR